MNSNLIAIQAKITQEISLSNTLLAIYLFMAIRLVHGYFTWDFNVYLGLMLAPFICRIEKNKASLRYLVPALIAAGLAIILPVKTILFIAILFTVLLVIENSKGKISHVVLFLLLLISPVFKHLTALGELPVRLWISREAAHLLNSIGIKAIASGNMISLNNVDFFVDPACAGLNMLATSLLTCLVAIAFYQRKSNKQIHFLALAALLILTIALNIICNFFRVILLILFKAMPETFIHDFIGIICLILYVLIPLMYTCELIFKYFISSALIFEKTQFIRIEKTKLLVIGEKTRFPVLHLVLLASIILISFNLKAINSLNTKPEAIILKGYERKNLNDGIIKFESPNSLVYLKPTAFYAPAHDPMVCWTGSGYHFINIKTENFCSHMVYTATLQKGKDKIYSAWWFDNGKMKSINQFKWRWSAAKCNAPFYLINVNSPSPEILKSKVDFLLSNIVFH